MRLKKILLSIVVIYACYKSSAQSEYINYSRIGIGDKIPEDLPFMNLVNYPKSEARIIDFKGKWLILDYWFTGCKPCIESWPKLMQLQKKYGDQIQILPVNHMQSREVVESFIARRNKGSKEPFLLPSVTGDSVLYKVLPPFGYPSVIWIDPQGVYRASTSGLELNEENIQLALSKGNIQSLVVNTSFINLKRPLFIDGNGGTGQQMLWYSTISRYTDKIRDGISVLSADSSGYVLAFTHSPILDLIMRAYSEGPFNYQLVNYIRLPQTRIELRMNSHKKAFLDFDKGVRRTNKLYTYQLISYEPKSIDQLKKIMRNDLQSYFELDFRWERKIKKCLVLTAVDGNLLGDDKFDIPMYGYNRKTGDMYIKDVPVSNFFGYLTEYIGGVYNSFDGYPLIDETGFKGCLDIVFYNVTNQNSREIFQDYSKLNMVLARYKMNFKLEEREVDVLVVRESEAGKNQ